MNLFNQQIAEIKVSYSHSVKPSERLKVTCSKDAYRFVLPLWPDIEYRESFAILLLNRAMKVLGLSWISLGGVAGTVVDSKIIFQAALKANASSVILVHNHPSGTMQASDADLKITRKIVTGASYLDITVPDHIIISPVAFLSMADEGFI